MLTDEDLSAIEARMEDSCQKWHILIAQQDLKRLLAEVRRLRKESESDAVPPWCARSPSSSASVCSCSG